MMSEYMMLEEKMYNRYQVLVANCDYADEALEQLSLEFEDEEYADEIIEELSKMEVRK